MTLAYTIFLCATHNLYAHTGLHGDQITSVQCCDSGSGSGPCVLTASRDNALKVVDTRTYETLAALTHDYYRTASNHGRASISSDGRHVAAGSGDKLVYIWEVTGERLVAQLESHEAAVMACCWSPGGGRGAQLASCDKDGVVAIWS